LANNRVVIVGGGGGGDAAAFGLRKKGFSGEIVILSADVDRPYDRPYLSKEFLRREVELPKVYLHDEAEYQKQGIDLRLETRATEASLRDRTVSVDGGRPERFDMLILSLGGTPRRLAGAPDAINVHTLRSLRDCSMLRESLASASRLLLVGAGFIGAEVAASARKLGKDVLIIEAAPVPLERALGKEVGEVYAAIHHDHGADLRTGTHINEWHVTGGRVTGVTLSDGRSEDVDIVLVAIGIEPNLDLPRTMGLAIESGGVKVDPALRAADGVYVVGDIALHDHPLHGPIRVEHWEVAKNHGRGVAASIADHPTPYSKVPYFWSDQYDVSLEYRGHASGEDRAVWRGDRGRRQFSVFYLRDGRVHAVLSMNDKETGEAGAKLIESRRVVDERELADASVELVTAG
jgi:3-phenylpropionate/trans-cinnamate dioxygenase ferredoxin reductase component